MRPPRSNGASRGRAQQPEADSIDVPRLYAFSDALLAIHASGETGWSGPQVVELFARVLDGAEVSFGSRPRSARDETPRASENRMAFECTLDGQTHQLEIVHERPFDEVERFMARALVRHLTTASRMNGPAAAESVPAVEARVGLSREGLREMGLTAMESEIMEAVVRGEGNGEIASRLGRSRRTIEKHMENILGKLGVETRLAAARAVLRWLESRVPGAPPR